jgi:hypothetical protein
MATKLTIVHAEDEVDLRTVVARSAYLRRIASKYSLKPYECVCFTNKKRTRFRLILRVSGDPGAVFLCIPEIDEKSKYSIYLKVSETLARLTGLQDIKVHFFDELTEYTKRRIQRSKAWHKARKKKK